jgi:hypothetical protein
MSCREGRGLVTKEQLGVVAGWVDRCIVVLERQRTHYPAFVPPAGRADIPLIVMKDAPITHEETPSGSGFEFAEWGDAVLPWQRDLLLRI